MEEHFYSTTACAIISYWPPEVAELIYAFSFQIPQTEKKAEIIPTSITTEQIIEARDDSYNLVREYLAANVQWQKILNNISDSRNKLEADLQLLTKAIKELVAQTKPDSKLKKLEQEHKLLKEQEQLLDNLEEKLALWRAKELNVVKGKWESTWREHKKIYANELITKLKEHGNIKLSALEKAELLKPTKTRKELLFDLKNFYPKGLPKGWNKDSELFNLRALWVLGAYRNRTLTVDE